MQALVDGTLEWLAAFDLAHHPEVERTARLLLLDTVACAVAGFAMPEISAVLEGLARDAPGNARWPGMPRGLSPAAAAYAGAMAACWHEACEGLARAHGRPGLHAVPPALSLALAGDATLGELIECIVWGYELGGRFGEALRIQPGMHVDGCWGALGSAAAAMRLGGADGARVRTAMAIAACQLPNSRYLPVQEGCTARNTYAAHAAAMAVFYRATTLAGCTAPAAAFLDAARCVVGDPERAVWPWAPPGEFLILQGYLKPYAAVRHVHYPAHCAIEWHRLGLDPARVDTVTLETYAEALTYCGNRAPATAIQAQFSLSYGTAYALRHGELGPDAYGVEALRDPEQRRLEAAVLLRLDPALEHRGARLTVRTDAEETTFSVRSIPGDPDSPLGRARVSEKALRFMSPSLGDQEARALIDAILDAPLAASPAALLAPPDQRL
jgi:2-methylcitrate dehydratase PrpD